MAKTKEEEEASGRPQPKARNNNNNKNIKDKNNDRNKKNLENGLYVHSSPPKALNSNSGHGSATIRDYIRAADIASLEEVVLQGQGTKLVNQPATDPRVRNFLKTVPSYMSKIDLIHDAVEKGNLRELKALLDRRKLARSRDAHGVGLLHKAVVHDHRAIVDYLISDYPETLEVTDNEGRTALHYCAASNFPDDMYAILCDAVSDTQVQDNKGKTAADYMSNPRELNVSRRRSHKGGSGGSKSKNRTPKKRGSPGQIRTPPKREGMNITGANIRIWIHDKDLSRLEQIVWEGQGHRLLKETSNNAKVRQFLNLVPRMMTKIKEVHQAALNGDLETLDAKVDQPDILIAKDQNGLNPLHKSAALGHKEVSEWIVQKNQSTIFAQDRKGRTPLFYAGVAKDGGEVYDMILRSGADASHTDQYRKTAEHYRFKPNELDVSIIHETPVAPRGGGGSTLDIPGPSNQNSRAPSRSNRSRNPSRRNSTGSDKKGHSNNKDKDGKSSAKSDDMDFKDMKDVTDADIERYIREGDLDSLENIILSGRGADLQGKSSWNEDVRRFLKRVPGYMEKITSLHDSAASGNMTNVRRLAKENGKLVMAKGKDGGVGLHYAARSGDPKITKYLLGLYPPAVDVEDNDGKNPLHYAALSQGKGARETYELLKREGASTSTTDLSGNTPEDYLQSPGMNHLNPGDTFVSGLSPRPGRQSRAPSKSPSKGPSRAPSKSPARAPSKSPAVASPKDSSKGPPKGPAKAPAKGPAKGPAKDSQKKNVSKEPSKNKLSKEPTKDNISKGPSKGPSPNPSKAGSRAPSKGPTPIPSPNPSPNPSRAGSRAPTPSVVSNGATDKEIQAAISAAEKDENFKPLTEIIVRGDGDKLIGKKSKDPEVDEFLKQVPKHLAAIEELHEAVEDGETRKVMNLLDKKQKAYVRDSHQANILHKAVLYGHTDLVRYLVSTFPDLMKQEDEAGRTPQHYAAVIRDGGHIYKILEKEGADDDVKDDSGHTPNDYKTKPNLLTQWDLMRELKDGTADSQVDSKGRPFTKGSIASTYYGSEEDGMERIDPDTLAFIEKEYAKLKPMKSRMLMKKYLTKDVFDQIKHRITAQGATLYDVIKSGLANPDSSIGLYAPDAESYTLFHELFDPVIDEYHGGFGPTEYHPGINFGTSSALGDLNKWGDYVVSTRVRCARSLEGYPFNPLLTSEQYAELEQDIENALDTLDDDLAGYYRPINRIAPQEQEELLNAHLLFKQGDRFLEEAGACRYWPDGRGIFFNSDRTLVVWVNEEDHMRIISMQKGGNLAEVYDRFVRAVTALGNRLPFSFSQRLGFLNFCPTNLGSAIRASVHARLPMLGQDRRILEATADQFHLQVRGTSGEHSEAKDFIFDISNRRRLGLTEIEALKEMYDGVKEILRLEKSMEASTSRSRKGSVN